LLRVFSIYFTRISLTEIVDDPSHATQNPKPTPAELISHGFHPFGRNDSQSRGIFVDDKQ
jgi:hypothetical protein